MTNWNRVVSISDKAMHSVEQVQMARKDIKSKMHDCDDFTQLNLITELAISYLAANDKGGIA